MLSNGIPVFSAATFVELETRLWKPKFDRYLSMESWRAILRDANAAAHWVNISESIAAQRKLVCMALNLRRMGAVQMS